MTFEHFVFNLENPNEVANGYVKNCQMKIIKSVEEYPYTKILVDFAGNMVLEIYSNINLKINDFS